MTKDKNKIKLLVLWDILCKNTDENHAMNSDEIREELAKRGISVMRKVVATDIDALNKYGYEVLSYKKKYYYYYDVSRPFTSDFYCATTWRRKAKYGVIEVSNKKAERSYSPGNVPRVYSCFNPDTEKVVKKE